VTSSSGGGGGVGRFTVDEAEVSEQLLVDAGDDVLVRLCMTRTKRTL